MSMLFFTLYDLAFQAELAFSYAYSMSKSNETIYEADFEASKVKEIYANYHGDLYSFLAEYPLEEKLSKEVEFSKIQRRQLSQFVKYYLPERYKWPKI